MPQPPFEVADVIRTLTAADGAVAGLRVSAAQQRVLDDLAACRTAKLGGHVDACDACGELRVSYNSCRNRHCPKCQAHQRAAWLQDRCVRVPEILTAILPEILAGPNRRTGSERHGENR